MTAPTTDPTPPAAAPAGYVLTYVQVTDPRVAVDVKRVHDVVLQATHAGEPFGRALWSQPSPRYLVIRHTRAVTARDLPRDWGPQIAHRDYWWPPDGAVVDWAVTVDASQSGQTAAQYARESAERAAGLVPGRTAARPARRPSAIRTPEQMADVVTGRLAPVMTLSDVTAGRLAHRVGRRPAGNSMHSNQVPVQGRGVIVDAAALHALMDAGIGRGRAFGCGLVLARPAGAPR